MRVRSYFAGFSELSISKKQALHRMTNAQLCHFLIKNKLAITPDPSSPSFDKSMIFEFNCQVFQLDFSSIVARLCYVPNKGDDRDDKST